MVCLDSPSSEEGSCIFQDPAELRGRTFRHDLQKASWKVYDEDPARSTEDKLYYREGNIARDNHDNEQEFVNYIIMRNKNWSPMYIIKHMCSYHDNYTILKLGISN